MKLAKEWGVTNFYWAYLAAANNYQAKAMKLLNTWGVPI